MEEINMSIDWQDTTSHILINPTYPKEEQERFAKILDVSSHLPSHIWLSTSGSSVQKWVGLSKGALLSSAAAVNRHLESSSEDCWVNTLPHFHVGGLGIVARAYMSGSALHEFPGKPPIKWKAAEFCHFLHERKGTLTALVPAQLYDIVALQLKPPSSLRAVVVGGGALPQELYTQAFSLGWPVLPSYGLTECASQVATASIRDFGTSAQGVLKTLSHMQGREVDGRLAFSGPSLLSTYAYVKESAITFVDPKIDGWFITEDRGSIAQKLLTIKGREDAICKVGGENVDLSSLNQILQGLRLKLKVQADVALVALPDERVGRAIHLLSDCAEEGALGVLIEQYQKKVLPFERIRGIRLLKELPRSPLGKLKSTDILL